jgi:photosystem II stability/assembly factor-like uncharacterized protein
MYKMANKFIKSDTSLACLSVAVSGVKAIAIGVKDAVKPPDIGRIHYSTNGGQTWNPAISKLSTGASAFKSQLFDLVVMDTVIAENGTNEYAIAVSNNSNSSKIYYSTDGGKTWSLSTISVGTFTIKSVAIRGKRAFAVCNDAKSSKIYYSVSGGAKWTLGRSADNFPVLIASVAMNDVIATAVGYEAIYKCNPTGTKWTKLNVGNSLSTYDIVSVAMNGPHIFACGSHEKSSLGIKHMRLTTIVADVYGMTNTIDGAPDYMGEFNSVAVCGSNAIAVGVTSENDAVICHSKNRGENWTSIGSLGDGVFNSVVMCGGKALAVGRTTAGATRIMSSDNNGTSWYNALASMSDGISPGIFKAAMSTQCTILAGYGTGAGGSKIALPVYYYSPPATAANTY